MILLDTHALIWLSEGNSKLGDRSRQLADEALQGDRLAVSAITFWETAMLQVRERIELLQPVSKWRESLLEMGLTELPVTGDVGILAVALEDFHTDPADRLIVATASLNGATLVTADKRILQWTGTLQTQNARQ